MLFVLIYLLLFSPKIGFFDFKILIIPLLFPFIQYFNLKSSVQKILFLILLLLSFFVFFQYFFDRFFFIDNLRYIRSVISYIAILIIVNKYKNEKIIRCIYIALLLQAIAIISMVVFPDLYQLSAYWGYQGIFRDLRAPGMSAGFDVAGFFMVAGFLLSWTYFKNSILYFLGMLLFLVAGNLTSRGTIFYLLILSVYFAFSYFQSSQTRLKYAYLLFIMVFGYVIIGDFLYQLFIQTVDIGIEFSSGAGTDLTVASYSVTDPVMMIESMIVFPNSYAELIFGAEYFPESDIGYIQSIYGVGLFGLLLTILFYGIAFYQSLIYLKSERFGGDFLFKTNVILLALVFIASIKNQYFFTRGVFDLVMLIFFIVSTKFNVKRSFL